MNCTPAVGWLQRSRLRRIYIAAQRQGNIFRVTIPTKHVATPFNTWAWLWGFDMQHRLCSWNQRKSSGGHVCPSLDRCGIFSYGLSSAHTSSAVQYHPNISRKKKINIQYAEVKIFCSLLLPSTPDASRRYPPAQSPKQQKERIGEFAALTTQEEKRRKEKARQETNISDCCSHNLLPSPHPPRLACGGKICLRIRMSKSRAHGSAGRLPRMKSFRPTSPM